MVTVSYSIGAKRGDVPWVVWFSGVPRLTPHDLRHTAASAAIVGHGPVLVRWDHGSYTLPIRVRVCLWLASGVSISTIQAWLGHSSLQTTQIYVHYSATAPIGPAWTYSTGGERRGCAVQSIKPEFP